MKTTKELARELGLIRKRTLKQGATGKKDNSNDAQHFAYLIVIDFESTCWKDKRNPNQEIIEFPAVLLNTSTGSVEDEFHTYCLPEEHPRLTSFCTELTGITQEQVEGGIPLFLCLKKFTRWLKKLETDKGITYNFSNDDGAKLCTFVTWSDWDLGVCLHYECQRKQLPKPEALKCWNDLRATYRKFYQRVPNGLEGALKDLGIQFEGRQHSGLDDARNTANLAWRMIRDGCQMKITKNISSRKTCDPIVFGPGQKQGTSVTIPPPVKQLKVIQPACQFSNKRKTLNLRSTNSLQRLTASPELHTRGMLSTPALVRTHVGGDSNSHTRTNRSVGSESNPLQLTKIISECTVPVYGISGSVRSDFKTPARPEGTSITIGCMSRSTLSGTRDLAKTWPKRTPPSSHVPSSANAISSNMYKTPNQRLSVVKITPPLCNCGKRSRKRNVFSPGPNQGRTFYSCCNRRRGKLQDVTNFTGGCNFFKWESVLIKGLKTPLLNRGSVSI